MPPRPRFRPFQGVWAHDTRDALVAVQAAQEGIIPLLERRPTRDESTDLIRSGSLFIFHEGTSGMKRWTDGFRWSDSRIKHNYLLYAQREDEPRTRAEIPPALYTRPGLRLTYDDIEALLDCIAGSWRDKPLFHLDILLEKTILVSTGPGDIYHVVSYYTPRDVLSGALSPIHLHHQLRNVEPSREGLLNSQFRFPPERISLPGDAEGDLQHYGGETGRACRVCALGIVRGVADAQGNIAPRLGPLSLEPPGSYPPIIDRGVRSPVASDVEASMRSRSPPMQPSTSPYLAPGSSGSSRPSSSSMSQPTWLPVQHGAFHYAHAYAASQPSIGTAVASTSTSDPRRRGQLTMSPLQAPTNVYDYPAGRPSTGRTSSSDGSTLPYPLTPTFDPGTSSSTTQWTGHPVVRTHSSEVDLTTLQSAVATNDPLYPAYASSSQRHPAASGAYGGQQYLSPPVPGSQPRAPSENPGIQSGLEFPRWTQGPRGGQPPAGGSQWTGQQQ